MHEQFVFTSASSRLWTLHTPALAYKTKLSERNRQKLQPAEVKLMLQWPKARLLFCATGTTVAHVFDFGMACFWGPMKRDLSKMHSRASLVWSTGNQLKYYLPITPFYLKLHLIINIFIHIFIYSYVQLQYRPASKKRKIGLRLSFLRVILVLVWHSTLRLHAFLLSTKI